jgi:hypothetical protein
MFNQEAAPTDFGKLKVAHVIPDKGIVCIVADVPDMQERMTLLNTQDAKRLALSEAVKHNWHEPSLKYTSIGFGDPTKASFQQTLDPTKMDKMTPYLYVEIFSRSVYETTPIGDSQ